MGALERKDIITEDALAAPMVLTKELEKILAVQDQITAKSKEMFAAISSGVSTDRVKKGIQDLTDQQKEQLKVMDAISKESAKNTDSYRAAQIALQKLKDENKLALATQDSWTKSVTQANSSLIQLEQALNKNRVAYAALRTEQDRNSKTGKDLLHVIQDQDKGVKAIRDSMGQAQAHVGGYREEIEKLIPTLRRLSGPTADTAENLVLLEEKATLFGSGLALTLGGIAAAVAVVTALYEVGKFAVEQYFERTIEGADRAEKISAIFSATIETVKDKFALLGEKLVDVFENKKFQTGFLSTIIAAFPVISAIVVLLEKQTGILGDIIAKYKITKDLAEVENALKKEQLEIGIKLAEQEKRKNEDLFDSRDKLRKSDQDRFNAALDQRKAIEEIIRLKLEENDKEIKAANDELKISGDNYANEQRLSDLKAKRINIEAELFQGQRRSLQTLASIAQEVGKRELAAETAAQDAIIKLRENTYKDLIDINKRIVGNQNYTVEQQIEAERQLNVAQVDLAAVVLSKELAAAKEAAIVRIQLTSDEQDKIFEESNGNVIKLASLERELKESKLKEDKEYQTQSRAINEQATSEKEKIERDQKANIGKIIIDNGKYWLELRKRLAEEDANADLVALNKKFIAGEIGIIQYDRAKIDLQRASANKLIDLELAEYKEQIDNLLTYQAVVGTLTEEQYKTLQALQKSFSDAELKQTQLTVDQKEALYKKAKAETIKIVSELANAIQSLGDTQFQADIAASQHRLDLLSKEHDLTVKAAGDNKNALAAIDRKYTKDVAIETEKQNAIKRKQAQFDKVASEFKVISATAAGIAQAYEDFPYPVATVFAVLIGAVAALQLAAISAAPLPAYAEGTDNHPGGLAVVGHGRELVREPGRKPFIVSSPEVMNLARGTEVLTDSETTAALAMAGVARSVNGERQVPAVILQAKEIVEELRRLQMPDIFEQNGEILKAYKNRDGGRRIVRAKWTNQ